MNVRFFLFKNQIIFWLITQKKKKKKKPFLVSSTGALFTELMPFRAKFSTRVTIPMIETQTNQSQKERHITLKNAVKTGYSRGPMPLKGEKTKISFKSSISNPNS